jgi:hypothetical protein
VKALAAQGFKVSQWVVANLLRTLRAREETNESGRAVQPG